MHFDSVEAIKKKLKKVLKALQENYFQQMENINVTMHQI